MRVLVTGGTGFAGSPSVSALLAQGRQVRLLVRSRDRVARAHAAAVYSVDPRAATRIRQTNVRAAEIVLGAAVRMGLDTVVHVIKARTQRGSCHSHPPILARPR